VKYTTDAIARSIIQESARKKEGKTVADKNVYEVVWPHNTLLNFSPLKRGRKKRCQPPLPLSKRIHANPEKVK
jgi:hypothetical protein